MDGCCLFWRDATALNAVLKKVELPQGHCYYDSPTENYTEDDLIFS